MRDDDARTSIRRLTTWFRANVLHSPFFQDVGALTLSKGVTIVSSFAQGIIVARFLGPTKYGVAALIMSYPSVIFSVLDARSADATVKYLGEFSQENQADKILGITKLGYLIDGGVALVAVGIVALTAGWAAENIVGSAGVESLILIQALAFLPHSLKGSSRAVLMDQREFNSIAWVESLSGIIRSGLIVGLVFAGLQVEGVIWGNALGLAVAGGTLAVIAYRKQVSTWGRSWLAGSLSTLRGRGREILSFLAFNDLGALLALVVKQMDLPVLGYFGGPTDAGFYRLAKSAAALTGNVISPLQTAAYPRFASLVGARDYEELKRVARRYALLIALPLALLVLLTIPIVPMAISIIYGPEFLPAAAPSQILLSSSAVWLAFFWLRPFVFARGLVRLWFGVAVVSVVVGSIGYVTLVPSLGAIGMALTIGGQQVIGHLLAFLLTARIGFPEKDIHSETE